MFFVTFPCGILDQVWYLIVLIHDLCCLSYFDFFHVNHQLRDDDKPCGDFIWDSRKLPFRSHLENILLKLGK